MHTYTFYKVEKTGREQMRLLAKLQDVNLNQIQSTTFIGANYFGLKDMYYNGKFIFFGVTNIEGDLTEFYFTYDTEKNKISQKKELQIERKEIIESLYPISSGKMGYIVRTIFNNLRLEAIDDSGKKLYSQDIILQSKANQMYFEILLSTSDILIYKVKSYSRISENKFSSFIMLIDPENGNLIKKIDSNNDNNETLNFMNAYILENQITLFGDKFKPKRKIDKRKSTGFFKLVLDKNGETISQQTINWTDVAKHLEVDKNGKNNDKKYIYSHEFVHLENENKTILFGEYFKPKLASATFFDFEVFEFDTDFNLIKTETIEKGKNVMGVRPLKYSYIDFNYLENKKGVSFSYRNINNVSLTKGIDLSLGTVTYFNDSFSLREIENKMKFLITIDYVPSIVAAKPGYFMIIQPQKNENPEIRLEHVDY